MDRVLGAMWAYVCQPNLIQRTVFVVDGGALHCVEGGVRTINDFTEDSVFPVQMGLLAVCYEELRLVCIWARVCHSHHTAGVELKRRKREGERKASVRSTVTADRKGK